MAAGEVVYMRKVLVLMLAMLMLAAPLALAEGNSENEDYIGPMKVVNCDAWVSLRAEPDTKSARLAQVPLGAGVEDCTQFDERFIYGCYAGRYGYILDAYLVPVDEAGTDAVEGAEGTVESIDIGPDGIDADGLEPGERARWEGTIMVEGEPETIVETLYESEMGLSIWYDAEAFEIVDDAHESDAPSFYMEANIDLPEVRVMLEFLSPEITGMSGIEFLGRSPMDHGVKLMATESGATEAGGEWQYVAGLIDDREMRFYVIYDSGFEVQAIATISEEAVEGYGPQIQRIIESVTHE